MRKKGWHCRQPNASRTGVSCMSSRSIATQLQMSWSLVLPITLFQKAKDEKSREYLTPASTSHSHNPQVKYYGSIDEYAYVRVSAYKALWHYFSLASKEIETTSKHLSCCPVSSPGRSILLREASPATAQLFSQGVRKRLILRGNSQLAQCQ